MLCKHGCVLKNRRWWWGGFGINEQKTVMQLNEGLKMLRRRSWDDAEGRTWMGETPASSQVLNGADVVIVRRFTLIRCCFEEEMLCLHAAHGLQCKTNTPENEFRDSVLLFTRAVCRNVKLYYFWTIIISEFVNDLIFLFCVHTLMLIDIFLFCVIFFSLKKKIYIY